MSLPFSASSISPLHCSQLVEPQGCQAGGRPRVLLGVLAWSHHRNCHRSSWPDLRPRCRHFPGHVVWHFARNYVVSFAAVLALGFLLLVSLLVSTGLAAAGKCAATYLP